METNQYIKELKMQKPLLYFFLIALLTCGGINVSGIDQINTRSDFPDEGKNMGDLDWTLWGYRPNTWRMNFDFNRLTGSWAEYQDIPIEVPGSVHKALKHQGIIPDWNIGLNYIQNEWIENRHWLIGTRIPDDWITQKENWVLHCKGLDYKGLLMVNGKEVGRFNNAFIPYSFNISPFLKEKNNTLVFIFECPPEHLGQIGYTSLIKDWKPRFNFGWDWVPRIVQTGIWDEVWLQSGLKNQVLHQLEISPEAAKDRDEGSLFIKINGELEVNFKRLTVSLMDDSGKFVLDETVPVSKILKGNSWSNLNVKRWYPNGWGNPSLYLLRLIFYDNDGKILFKEERRLGFKHVEWLPCRGAPKDADPWICSINNRPVFLQGVNWTPIRPNFADLKKTDYQKLLNTYKNLGINTIRIWGGGFPEKIWLYELCDELGILIWQDFPLSSSGLDNYPPTDSITIAGIRQIVQHYINRLKNHVSILLWCGGNELYERGDKAPVGLDHPLIAAIEKVVKQNDPGRRFLTGTPSGPSIYSHPEQFGKGIHWDTHGPWKLPFSTSKRSMDEVREFWKQNDSFFFSEVGVPGAMSAQMIEKYRGTYPALPASLENPIWRTVNWWNEWDEYVSQWSSEEVVLLENYVSWSQKRQTEGLGIALKNSKEKFPACGGFLVWMGHDCFPCLINTSIIDFEGNPKPVAERLSQIWKNNQMIIFNKK